MRVCVSVQLWLAPALFAAGLSNPLEECSVVKTARWASWLTRYRQTDSNSHISGQPYQSVYLSFDLSLYLSLYSYWTCAVGGGIVEAAGGVFGREDCPLGLRAALPFTLELSFKRRLIHHL